MANLAGTKEPQLSPWLGCTAPPAVHRPHYDNIDRQLFTLLNNGSASVAPATAALAFGDWATHLWASPAKQLELMHLAASQVGQFASNLTTPRAACDDEIALPQDKRFADAAWNQPPFHLTRRAFLLAQHWWAAATTGVPGVQRRHEQQVAFAARQWLDMFSPSNSALGNPTVLERTLREGGVNLLRGAAHALEDVWRDALRAPPAGAERYVVGRDLAATPGDVVLRNRLIELIRYAPIAPTAHGTPSAKPRPILLVPAWIMKYYILDLSPHNSLVQWLRARGHVVYAISWKNPDAGDRDLGLDDYARLGVRAALDAIAADIGPAPVHALGYCLGGTLLAATAAALARQARTQQTKLAVASLTLLAAQTDFTEPGELSLFVDEGQIHHLENLMWKNGYLDDRHMRRTFQLMRSNDLIWSARTVNYLLGERRPITDMMAWNADGTRLPYRMHSQYLRELYLGNALSHGEFQVEGRAVNLADIRVPIFNVGAVQDHVAPWRSVFKLHALTDAEQTFVLTAGGHNLGIINPPGNPKSSYRLRTWRGNDRLLTPDEWLAEVQPVQGSWWTAWGEWLNALDKTNTARLGAPQLASLGPAPGQYVFQR